MRTLEDELLNEIEFLQNELEQSLNRELNLRNEVKSSQEQIKTLQNELEKSQKQIENYQTSVKSYQTELDLILERRENLRQQLKIQENNLMNIATKYSEDWEKDLKQYLENQLKNLKNQ